jgi:hypothetical protein
MSSWVDSDIHEYFREFESGRFDVTDKDVSDFETVLAAATDERAIQQFLQGRPQLLCAYMRSGHGEWVLPQKRLGAEYVPDFVIGHGSSGGVMWDFIELESPRSPFLLKSGQPSRELRNAVHQIESWRTWLRENLAYAQKPPASHGLGLLHVSPMSPAMIVIGRRQNITEEFNVYRQRLRERDHIKLITYDRLLDDFRWISGVITGARIEHPTEP